MLVFRRDFIHFIGRNLCSICNFWILFILFSCTAFNCMHFYLKYINTFHSVSIKFHRSTFNFLTIYYLDSRKFGWHTIWAVLSPKFFVHILIGNKIFHLPIFLLSKICAFCFSSRDPQKDYLLFIDLSEKVFGVLIFCTFFVVLTSENYFLINRNHCHHI